MTALVDREVVHEPEPPALEPARPRWLIPGVLAAMGLAGLLGAFQLGHDPLWYDESFSVLFSDTDWSLFWRMTWVRDLNALAYYLLLRGWINLTGVSEVQLRALSVILMVLTVPVVAAVARRLFGDRAAVVAAVLFATHGGMLQYAQEARTYALVTFTMALAAWCFVVAVQDRTWSAWIGFAVIAGIGLYAHLFAAFVTVALLASLAALPPRRVRRRQVTTAIGLYGLFVVPVAAFLTQAQTGQFDWVGEQLDGAFDRSIFFLAGNASRSVQHLTVAVLGVLLLSWLRRTVLRGRTDDTWAQVLVVSWAVAPVLLAIGVSQIQPILVPRYVIVAVPGVVLMMTGVLRLIWGTRTLVVVVALTVVAQLTALPSQLYGTPEIEEQWRDLAVTLAQQSSPEDALIMIPRFQRVPLEYYLSVNPDTRRDPDDLPEPLAPIDRWRSRQPFPEESYEPIDVDGRAHPRVWLIFDADRHRPELIAQEEALAGWRVAQQLRFGELTLRAYEPT